MPPLDPRIGLAFQPTQYLDTGALLGLAALQDRRNAANEKWKMDLADQSLEAGAAAYENTPGDEETKNRAALQARNQLWINAKNSGMLSQHGINEAAYNQTIGAPWNHALALYRTMGAEKGQARINERKSAEAVQPYSPNEPAPAIGPGVSPAAVEQPKEQQNVPLSDVSKPLQVKGLDKEPPVQTSALEPEKNHVEPPMPQRPGEQQVGTDSEGKPVYGKSSDVELEGSTNDLRKRAQHWEKQAEDQLRLGTKQGREESGRLFQVANQYRQRAEAIERQELNREKFDANNQIQQERIKLATQRAAATQQPLDPETAKLLGEAVARGNYAIASGLARNQVAQRQLKEAVGEYARAHGWNADDLNHAHMQFSAAMKTEADFSAGQAARNVTAINTAIGHMGTMSELADAMGTGNVQSINAVVNKVRTQFGDPNITNFEIAKSAVANELMRVFRQVGASETEVLDWEKKFSSAQTPQQLRDGLNVASKLLNSRVEALGEQYKRGTGRERGDILSPEARGSLETIQRKSQEKSGRFPKVKPFENPDEEKEYQEWKKKSGY